MSMKTIQIRVEDSVKEESDLLFKELGLTTNDAIKIFLKKAICTQSIPFEVSKKMPNDLTLKALDEAESIHNGKLQGESFSSVEDLFEKLNI